MKSGFAMIALAGLLAIVPCAQGQDAAAMKLAMHACGPGAEMYGVALQPAPASGLPAAQDEAILHFLVRGWSAKPVRIGMDGKWLGAIQLVKSGRRYTGAPYTVFAVAPGRHHLCIRSMQNPRLLYSVALDEVDAKAGQSYYFLIHSTGDTVFRPWFLNMDGINPDEATVIQAHSRLVRSFPLTMPDGTPVAAGTATAGTQSKP